MKKIAFFVCLAVSSPLDAAHSPWQQLAKADLDFIYQNLKDNHPGVIDKQNPEFNQWLENGYRQAVDSIEAVIDLDGVINIQRKYIAGFADGHVDLSFKHQRTLVQWPGFIIQKQGVDTVVTKMADEWPTTLPPIGAVLKQCNGLTPQQLLEQRVLPYHIQLPELTAVQMNYTPLILRMDGSWEGEPLTECEFTYQHNNLVLPLNWRTHSRQYWLQHNESVNTNQDFRLEMFAPEHYWISLPTFTPSAPQQTQLQQITAELEALKQAKVIVFDVRGNGGGNSQWGTDMVFALFGKPHVYDMLLPILSQGMAYWRASPQNTAAVAEIVQQMAEQFGQEADVTHAFRDLASRMTEHSGNELVPQSISVATTDIKAETSPSLTSARVVLLTDADCASACLDFADILLPLGAIHAGQPTFADTVYMDIRTVELPSKLGRLSIPQKVYRNRPRGHNQAYFPADKWYYQGNINNTAALRDWLLQQLATE